MSNITHLPGTHPQLTSAHRCLIARLQDICIDLTLATADTFSCEYDGQFHFLNLRQVQDLRGADGDGSFRACWSRRIALPPYRHDHNSPAEGEPDALHQLAEALEYLSGIMPQPGGAA